VRERGEEEEKGEGLLSRREKKEKKGEEVMLQETATVPSVYFKTG